MSLSWKATCAEIRGRFPVDRASCCARAPASLKCFIPLSRVLRKASSSEVMTL